MAKSNGRRTSVVRASAQTPPSSSKGDLRIPYLVDPHILDFKIHLLSWL
jgi:hypothetical protein